MAPEQSTPWLGYGLFGLGIGLVLFSITYLVMVRVKIALPTDPTWLTLFLAILFVPAVAGALVGRGKGASPPGL